MKISKSASDEPQHKEAKRRFLLHHMWKCGGTHLCDVARKSGFVVPQAVGCHRFKDDTTPVDSKTGKWVPCALGTSLANVSWDVIGHECGIDVATLDKGEREGFTWVTVVRDPVEQALSWLSHAKWGKAVPENATFAEWLRIRPGGFYDFVPNLQTRWLAGGRCSNDPETTANECVQLALANLRRMAAVLEQRGSELLHQDKLEKLGWTVEKGSNHSSGARHEMRELQLEAKAIEQVQHVDIALLKAARAEGLI